MRAMILAAGKGERLRPLTDACPKPLLKVQGKAIIEHILESLQACGVTDVVINVSYLAEQIQKTLSDGSKWDLKIHYSIEQQALESGGGIFNALPILGQEPFILINGDIWTDYRFSDLPKQPDGLGHLVLVPNPSHNDKGDFSLSKGKICASSQSVSYTYSGIAVLRPKLFAHYKKGAFPLAPLFFSAISRNLLHGELYQGSWTDVGTLERLQSVEKALAIDAQLKKIG